MRKYILSILLISILPGICFGASARYTQLVREKQRKMEQLEKCMGSTKGLKIAGISTLGLTAVGVAGNIAEASVIKKNEKTIDKQKTTLAEKQAEYSRKEDARREAEKERDAAKENWKNANRLKEIVQRDIDAINSLNVTIGTRVVVHGYDPSALPAGEFKNNLASAIINAIVKCKNLENHNGIKTVSLQDGDKPTWGNTSGNLDLEAVWTDLTEREIMVCNLVDCETNGYTKSGNACIPNGADCLNEITTTEPKATAAKKDSAGVCRIISCSEGNPSEDRQRCIGTLPGTPTTPNDDDGDGNGNSNIAERCTEEFAGVGEPYRTLDGAEFCTPYDWDSKEIVSEKCTELGLSLCNVPLDCPDEADCTSYWVCSTDCSVIPEENQDRPAWLRVGV